MSRYIDAEWFEKFIHRNEWGTPDETWRPESEFGKFIDYAPTENVIDVVRCNDCIFWDNYNGGNICRNVNGKAWAKPNDFCNEGRNRIE